MNAKLILIPLLATGLSASGCSWIFVQPLHTDDPGKYPHCTTSRVAPAIDTVFTATNLGSVLYVAGEDNVKNKGASIAVGLSVATLWLSSAIYGYSHTSECEAALEDDDQPRYRPPHHGYVPPRPAWTPPPAAGPPVPAPAQAPDGDVPGGGPSPARAEPDLAPASRPDAPHFGG